MKKRKIVYGYAQSNPPPANPHLMEAFKFTAYDLLFNQNGDLSDTQFKRLSNLRWFTIGLLAAIASIPIILGIGISPWLDELQHTVLFGSIMFIISMPFFGAAWSYGARYYKDIYTAQIESITDKVHLDLHTGQYGASLTMQIGKERFRLNKKQFLAFEKSRYLHDILYCKYQTSFITRP